MQQVPQIEQTITQSAWVPGTVGSDVMTVHKVRDGVPVCGAAGTVAEWRRKVTCPGCLTSE